MTNRFCMTLAVILLLLPFSASRSQDTNGADKEPPGSPEQWNPFSSLDRPDSPFSSGGDPPPELDGAIEGLFSTEALKPFRDVHPADDQGHTAKKTLLKITKMMCNPRRRYRRDAAYHLLKTFGEDGDKLFDALRGELKAEDAKRREFAATGLGELCALINRRGEYGDTRWLSFKTLAAAMRDDPEAAVREAAGKAVADSIRNYWDDCSRITGQLTHALSDPHPPVRAAALRAIGSGPFVRMLPDSVRLFEDPQADVRRAAAKCAGQLSERILIPETKWIEAAKARGDEGSYKRGIAWQKFTDENMPPAVKGLMKLAQDSDPLVRAEAVAALGGDWGHFGRPSAKTILQAILDENREVRAAAADSARVLGKQATPMLVRALQKGDWLVDMHAIESLGEIHACPGRVRPYVGRLDARCRVREEWVEGPADDPDRQDHSDEQATDTSEPSEIDPTTSQAAQALAKMLAAGYSDHKYELMNALKAIGPHARDAIPILAKALSHSDVDVHKRVLEILRHTGPAAKGEIPAITRLMRKHPENCFEAICALDDIATDAADTAIIIPPLIRALGDKDVVVGQRAAIALARRGDAALPVLLRALRDSNVRRQRSAAYAIAYFGRRAEDAVPPLAELLKDADPDAVWNAAQALEKIAPADDQAVSALIATLGHADADVRRMAVRALMAIGGEAARPAVPQLIKIVREDDEAWTRITALEGLVEIGLDRETAAALGAIQFEPGCPVARNVFAALFRFPDLALVLLKARPELPKDCPTDLLIHVIEEEQWASTPLRRALVDSPHLPVEIMAWLGDARCVPIIREQMNTASTHRRTFLEACARACGDKPSEIVHISEKCPGDFRPDSATGTGDKRRMPPMFSGAHGDGYTLICVTGRIVMEDGTLAVEPKFFNTNDRMLLGRRLRDEARIRYDAQTGRFVFLTHVFAAYAGGNTKEPGPFQTGAARVSIEAEGAKPLEVLFFDEMPEVLITLSTAK